MAKKEANNQKENSKNKRSFFKDFKAELKKVNWPTPKQLINNTTAVVTIVIITAAIVFVLDLAFETLNKHGVEKIKQVITTNSETVDNNQSNETNNTTDETATNENSEETPTNSENTETSNEGNNETETNTENQVAQ
ncbi:MAG: preprotein translocase subunit SecE [Clostridia bacterium]|nr:preprotein translocase subunit SecE [Clostridia bacterium]